VNKHTTTNVLLIIIAIILLLVLFQGKIRSYFKSREVLKKASIYNIGAVAGACFDSIPESESDYCLQTLSEYGPKIIKWNNLIKQNKDINCKDFDSRREAEDFYEYISGDTASRYYRLKVQNENLRRAFNKEPGLSSSIIGEIMQNKENERNCSYDPYGLDTNADCFACENY